MKILVVDDNRQDLYMLQALLGSAGYEVETAADGVEALAKLAEKPAQIVVADILMPRMDGFQLCREMKKSDSLKKIPFIFYTATYTDKDDESFAISIGAERFVPKPSEPDVLLEAIREVSRCLERGAAKAPKPPPKEEIIYLRGYSERLVRKLEDKTLELQSVIQLLRESEQKYRSLIEDANDAIVLMDLDGRLDFVNPRFCEMLGYSMDESSGLVFDKLVSDGDRAKFLEDMKGLLKGNGQAHGEYGLVTKPGEMLTVDWSAGVVRRDRKMVGVQGILRDVTARRRAELELEGSRERLRRAMEGALQSIVLTIEKRDPYSTGHQRRVAKLAAAIAREAGLTESQTECVRVAATIHDVGKMHVPAEIIGKPGRVTDAEFELIKIHPQAGHEILRNVEFPWPVADVVLQHHERMDGSGYPAGKTGGDILLEARVLAVADVVEAMTAHRPYRAARSMEEALDEIVRNRGELFDPSVVDACVRLINDKKYRIE